MQKITPEKIAEAREQAKRIAEARKENLRRLSEKPAAPEPVVEEVVAQVEEPVEEAPVQQETLPEEPVARDWEAELRSANDRWQRADAMLKQQGKEFREAKAEAARRAEEAEKRARELEAQMAELQSQMEMSKPVSSDDLKKYFTAEQIERLGEDECRELLSVQRQVAGDQVKVTRSMVQKELQEMRAAFDTERQSVAQLKTQAFWDAVDIAMPDWREIDATPEFNQWLETEDELSGRKKRDLGIDARDSLDVKRFVAVYKAYKATLAKPVANTPKRVLPNGVAPADGAPTQRKVAPLTLEEIRDFKAKLARGYYQNRPEEMKRYRERMKLAFQR